MGKAEAAAEDGGDALKGRSMTDLREAARRVVERWDSPAWKWGDPHTADLIHALRAALAREPEPAIPAGWRLVPTEATADMRNAFHAVTDDDVLSMGTAGSRWHAMLSAAPAAPAVKESLTVAAPAVEGEPVAPEWQGEEWERLAWHLCAEENGEEACNELVWEGGPIPEPWGDRWMKYEPEAKRMIELVRQFAAPPAKRAPLTDEQADDLAREMVKGKKSVNWLVRRIELAHNITGA